MPRGFGGCVEGWHELVPGDAPVLRLPAAAVVDGPFLRVPEGRFRSIHVEWLSEGFGNLEGFLGTLATRLSSDGELWIDSSNLQSPSTLRLVVEGRPGAIEPYGSVSDPERRVLAGRLFHAVESAGLWVRDCYRLPDGFEAGPRLPEALIREGFMAVGYAGGPPPGRLWLCCRNSGSVRGSVLIAGGRPEQREQTRSALAFLPSGWEVIVRDDQRESTGFNRAVADSHGEVLWFLRGGAIPTEAAFAALASKVEIRPVAIGRDGVEQSPGDLSGRMIARGDAVRIGPLDESFANPTIAYEDWSMRLEAGGRRPLIVDGPFDNVEPAIDAGVLEAEGAELVERWRGIGDVSEPVYAGPRRRVDVPPPPWAGRKPKVSLCMIAKDEERFLGDCLKHAAPAVDEIVIVDTGSTDRTIEIAESFGAKVVHEPWTDDFSAPRNVAMEHATGDWILILDADEILDEDSIAALRRAVEDPGVCAYNFRFNNVYTGGKTIGVMMMRLHRKLEGARWINRIHEQITPSLVKLGAEQGLSLSVADITVTHHGYTDEIMDSRAKNERNERLFRAQLADTPDEPYVLYKFGDFLRRIPGRQREARELLGRDFEMILEKCPGCPVTIPYAGEVAALYALEVAREENYELAEQILDQALRRLVPTPNLHYIAAGIAVRRSRPQEAIVHYRRCLEYHGQVLVVPIQEGITSYVSLTGMAEAYLLLGRRDKAEELLRRSRDIRPDYELTAMVMSRLQLEQGELQAALRTLTSHLQLYPESVGVCQQATLILARLGLDDQARGMGQKAVALLEADAMHLEANRLRQSLAALG